ncbi:MAG: hypothetical protein ACLP8S_31485 [Solirubrobacteraceae bacterium]
MPDPPAAGLGLGLLGSDAVVLGSDAVVLARAAVRSAIVPADGPSS